MDGNQTVQYPLVAVIDFTFADLASGVAKKAMSIPLGAIVTGGAVKVTTAWNSGTSAVLDVGGDVADDLATDLDLKTAGVKALETPYAKVSTAGNISVTLTAVGTAATAGAATLIVEYVVPGRANEVLE